MPFDSTQKHDLHTTLSEYLKTLELIHIWEVKTKRVGIDYQQHCTSYTFKSSQRDGPHHLYAPRGDWEALLLKIATLTEGRVNHRTVGQCLEQLCETAIAIPVSSIGSEESAFIDKCVEWMERAYDFTTTIYVPLANLEVEADVSPIQLARTKLLYGHAKSELSEYSKILVADGLTFEIPQDTPFLEIEGFGDDQCIERLVRTEVENALRVLRFSSWSATTLKDYSRKTYNLARDVMIYPDRQPSGYYTYRGYRSNPVNRYLGDITSASRHHINEDALELADLLGLSQLNGHYSQPQQPISSQIILAVEWYDSGLQAESDQDALYRYLVALNAIVAWDDASGNKDLDSGKMQKRLEKIFITTSSNDGTTITIDFLGELRLPKPINVEKVDFNRVIPIFAKNYAKLFKEMYIEQRNKILHGRAVNKGRLVTLHDVHNARLLGHNAIRLMMKIISDNPQWTDRNDIETWFETP